MTAAVGYLRVSGASQVEQGGFERQESAIRSCCVQQGMELKHVYREEGVAGKLGEEARPAFQRMVADLLGNGSRTIVVESLDRLARQYDVQQQLATYLASKQLRLISANTGEDITAALMGDPMRRALVQIQGIFAELDKNLLIAKLDKGRARRRAEDPNYHEGKRPYGELAGEADVLAQMRKLRKSGATYQQIADALNENSMPARSGNNWHLASIAKILMRSKGVS